MTWKEYEKKR